MRKLVLVFILAGLWLQAKSQNTGYLGKHVILKTDAINGLRLGFQNIDLEVVTGRELSFTGSFRRFEYAGTAKRKATEKDNVVKFPVYYAPGRYYVDLPFTETAIVYPGKTTGWVATIGVKYYFSRILPAPLGFYSSLDLGYGAAELNYGYEKIYIPYASHFATPFFYPKTTYINKCKLFFFNLPSIGYQKIVARRLALDAKFQFEGYVNDLSENFLEDYPYPYFSTNIGSAKAGNVTFGPAIYGKIGILLF